MGIDFLKINDKMVSSMQAKVKVAPDNAMDKSSQDFATYLKKGIDQVNRLQIESTKTTEKFMLGELENIHDVTIAAERAGLAMKTMLTFRKKLIDAHREISQIRL